MLKVIIAIDDHRNWPLPQVASNIALGLNSEPEVKGRGYSGSYAVSQPAEVVEISHLVSRVKTLARSNVDFLVLILSNNPPLQTLAAIPKRSRQRVVIVHQDSIAQFDYDVAKMSYVHVWAYDSERKLALRIMFHNIGLTSAIVVVDKEVQHVR